jgi:hypothetical protein
MLSELFEVGTDFSIMLVLCCSKQCLSSRPLDLRSYTQNANLWVDSCMGIPFLFSTPDETFCSLSNQIKYGINLKHNIKSLLEFFVSSYYTFNHAFSK